MTPGAAGADSGHRGTALVSRAAVSNLGAQGGALAAVSVASLLVARIGGPAVVGEYALLRVLPWLFGVVFSCGLPTASAFFLAGPRAGAGRLRPTLAVMTGAGAAAGALAWLACAVPFQALFFRQLPAWLIMVMAVTVVTQLITVTAKGCCQGSGDITGANLVIVAEELWFIICYPAVLLLLGDPGAGAVAAALIASGVLAAATGLLRLRQRRFYAGWGRPSASLARRVAAFGGRGQLGNMLWLTNLRFDFLLLGALAGPAALGIYAVASKFAELMRLVPTAINYVLYPRFAGLSNEQATAAARRLLPRAAGLTVIMTPLVAGLSLVALPVLYGRAFHAAVLPAEIIIAGLSIEGAAAVASAFLLGSGRPGLNSVGMGVGAVITVTLDLILIPRYGALGGAVTSAVTYLAATVVLTCLAYRVARQGGTGADTALRRAADLIIAATALLVVAPLELAAAAAVRLSSRGPMLYRQVRVGRSGRQFTLLKFRTMVPGADQLGPLVTDRSDPRVTRVGRWLRATKLDELPQLWNVVRGDMTIIGPRPEVPHFLPFYRAGELTVLRVRPGLTGLGQILCPELPASACGESADAETRYVNSQLHPKLAVDLDYLERRGLRIDVGIVLRTVALIFAGARTER